MSSPLLDRLAAGPLVADGAMGTLLYQRGVRFEECFDELNLSRPTLIESIHRDYLAAGAQIIETNTFGANALRLGAHGLADKVRLIARQGVKVARAAREIVGVDALVAGSVGPLGQLLDPFGQLTVAEAEGHYRASAEGLLEGGCDCFILETFQDLNEILAALRAVRRVSLDVPVIAQMTYGTDGKTLYGHAPTEAVRRLTEAGASVVGINCGVGPQPTLEMLEEVVRAAGGTPVSAMPNAGLPQMVDGRYVYLSSPEYFAEFAARAVELGVRIVGGCCGTTPAHTRAMRERLGSNRGVEKLAPGADVRVLEEAPAPVRPVRETEEPTLLRKLRERFVVSVEIDPPRGVNTTKVMEAARMMAQRGVDAINIADSPLARIRMSALALAYQIHQHFPRVEVILHHTTRDRNLMGLQSDLLGAHALGIRNILCLTGDPPSLGDYPNATAVFDTDAPGLMRICHRMNQGTDLAGSSIGAATKFAIGCGVNPTAEDLDKEFEYVRRKLDAGPQFVMTQPVYELGCWERFIERLSGLTKIPILIGILPLQSFRHAEFLHNEVPGIHVPDWIRARMHEAGNEGQKVGIELARELLAACRSKANGVYLMPSFGRFENCLEVLEGAP
ncbi:MAG: bifunctional homocysteine S-methyltransferase/methylenetetrahydrofolate reductase [Candidatus Eisenbacteria bacterium]|uniref:Bifunctional homocysteine S-methyltransferase/methylenetetrahydrofolate reductase n=1 Tax=Eiseniibacteriota bacterium TaxID=2212470 RepID=A0A9D6QJ40_UNCEI|nr:bifunctional homocysteine S-methyltransferase/methylenetetrahydrofolate reductase [Candidatus Eisenbacteria bacterium]MBI3540127.1 bifunctional homocysteine S-methyltransferase/methylenetetrahydrofolate reductase [Candidatus Eisenbacteria bacterium]